MQYTAPYDNCRVNDMGEITNAEEYIKALEEKLRECERLRDTYYNDRAHAEKIQGIYGEKLAIACEHLKTVLESQDDHCRFDHNANCQEHSWFGIGGKCPVGEAKKFLEAK